MLKILVFCSGSPRVSAILNICNFSSVEDVWLDAFDISKPVDNVRKANVETENSKIPEHVQCDQNGTQLFNTKPQTLKPNPETLIVNPIAKP